MSAYFMSFLQKSHKHSLASIWTSQRFECWLVLSLLLVNKSIQVISVDCNLKDKVSKLEDLKQNSL